MKKNNAYIGANSELATSTAMLKKFLKKINSSKSNYDVEMPNILSEEKMQAIYEYLRKCNYTIENCASRLGVDITGGVNFISIFRKDWVPDYKNQLDILISLLLDNEEMDEMQIINIMDDEVYQIFFEMNLLKKRRNKVCSDFCLFPCYEELFILTDKAEKNECINQVMFLWGESFFMADIIDQKEKYSNALDLCTGSGIHALVQSRHCDSVIGVDISERAIQFANFNKALNGIKNVEFHLGSIFETVKDRKFDLIIANPPYNLDSDTEAGANFWSGGKQGDEVLKLIFENITNYIEKEGLCFIISLYPNRAGYLNQDSIDGWMSGKLEEYSVLDFTYPAINFVCPHVKNTPSVDSKDYKFGLIAMKYDGSQGSEYRVKEEQFYTFGEDGSLKEERISRSSF